MQQCHYELVSSKLCPYVQRSVITLSEKHVDFVRTEISLKDKPSWFLQKSPTGKTPMLIVDSETILFESAVICEYIDETTQGSLLPSRPLDKARHRSWIQFGSQLLNEISRLYSAKSQPEFEQSLTHLNNDFSHMDAVIQLPFFSGEDFSLVDAVYAPIFRYFDVFEAHLGRPLIESDGNLRAWRNHLSNRPSVQSAVAEDYAQALIEFVIAKGSYLGNLLAAQNR